MELTLTEIIKKYSNIEDKIPSVWETYEEAGIELAQDLVYTWDIQNTELIRVISLVSGRVKGLKITQHIDPMFSFAGLYPEIQKVHNILPDPMSTEEIQRRVRENFKNIMETHAAAGLPVVISEDGKIYHLYKDGTKVFIKDIEK